MVKAKTRNLMELACEFIDKGYSVEFGEHSSGKSISGGERRISSLHYVIHKDHYIGIYHHVSVWEEERNKLKWERGLYFKYMRPEKREETSSEKEKVF